MKAIRLGSLALTAMALALVNEGNCAGNVAAKFTPPPDLASAGILPLSDGSFYAFKFGKLAHLAADGSNVAGFNCELTANSTLSSCAVDSAGNLFVGPYASTSNGYFSNIAKLTSSGAVDRSFAPIIFPDVSGGDFIFNSLNCFCADDSGGCFAGGLFRSLNGAASTGLVHLDRNGSVTSLTNPLPAGDSPQYLAKFQDSVWVVGNSEARIISSNGSVVTPIQAHAWNYVRGAAFSERYGMAIVAQQQQNSTGVRVYVYGKDGKLLSSFQQNPVFSLAPSNIAWDNQGRILAAGVYVGSPAGYQVRRLLNNGDLDPSWSGALKFNYNEFNIAALADDSVIVTGSFTLVNYDSWPGMVKLGNPPSTPIPNALNLSSRGYVDTTHRLILGFVIQGDFSQEVLLRAAGPTLSQFGVDSVQLTTRLSLYRGSDLIFDRIGGAPYGEAHYIDLTEASVGAFRLQYGGAIYGEARALLQLRAGVYTLVISAPNGGSGDMLGEVYFTQ